MNAAKYNPAGAHCYLCGHEYQDDAPRCASCRVLLDPENEVKYCGQCLRHLRVYYAIRKFIGSRRA